MKAHKFSLKTVKTPIYIAMAEFGFENFKIELIEEVDNSVLFERERFWIQYFNTLIPNGYNATPGGQALYGKENPFYGKTHSNETKQSISNSRIGKYTGENNPFYGKSHSDKTKQLLSIKNTGKTHSIECRELQSQLNSGENNPFYGKTHSDEMRKHLSYVKCTKNIYMYDIYHNFICKFDTMRDVYDYIIQNKLFIKSTNFKTISNVIRTSSSENKIRYNHYWVIQQ